MPATTVIDIDGSLGEGGGQIVRSSLALSLVTQQPCRVRHVRAGRDKPGLLRQHLTALNAATQVGDADVEGDRLGSVEVSFAPRAIRAGSYHFSVGTAGSTALVLQTVLPALMLADGPSEVVLEGGTHNPFAPPFDFLERVLLPLLNRMGPQIEAKLERPGFYPAGGGRFRVTVQPAERLTPLVLLDRGDIVRREARAAIARLGTSIARRELKVVERRLGWPAEAHRVVPVRESVGPGNVLTLEIASRHVTELFTGFGRRGEAAEGVAEAAVREARDYLGAGVPVGPYLADQLLLPLALAGAGSFRTVRPTRHTRTNAEIVRQFVDVAIDVAQESDSVWRVDVSRNETGVGS